MSKKKAERALKAQQAAQERFAEFVKITRRQITRARMIEDNEAKATMLESALKLARHDMEALELELGELFLSKKVTDDLVGALEQIADEADGLIKEMEELANILDKVEKGAQLISKALKTIANFV